MVLEPQREESPGETKESPRQRSTMGVGHLSTRDKGELIVLVRKPVLEDSKDDRSIFIV